MHHWKYGFCVVEKVLSCVFSQRRGIISQAFTISSLHILSNIHWCSHSYSNQSPDIPHTPHHPKLTWMSRYLVSICWGVGRSTIRFICSSKRKHLFNLWWEFGSQNMRWLIVSLHPRPDYFMAYFVNFTYMNEY